MFLRSRSGRSAHLRTAILAVLSAKNSDRRRHFSGSVEIFRNFTLFRQTRKTAPWVPVCRNYAMLYTEVIREKVLCCNVIKLSN